MSRMVVLTEIIAPYRIPVFNALARQPGVDLHVIFLAETDPTLREWEIYRSEISFPYEVLPSMRKRIRNRSVLLNWGVAAALRKAAPAAIVCGGYNYPASWKSLLWARRNRVPFFLWVESTLQDDRRGRAMTESLKRNFLKNCHGFVVPGKSSRAYVKSFGVADSAILTAPNAVENDRFARLANEARENSSRSRMGLPSRYILFVGRLVREKGVFDLVDAYGTLAAEIRSQVSLVFVGDGSARQELEQRAAGIAPGSICFRGFQQRDALAAHIAFADALVFPTYTDTWGLVVNEAMACSLPVIASSAAGCVADLVEDGENGFQVSPGNVKELAERMKSILCNPELRLTMGKSSWERIRAYSPEACAAGIAQVMTLTGAPPHE